MAGVIDGLPFDRPFALVKRNGEEFVRFFSGTMMRPERLDAIPRRTGRPEGGGARFDTLSILPFSQIRERGFAVHDGGETIRTIVIEDEAILSVRDVLDGIERVEIVLDGGISYGRTREEYEALIGTVIREEIGNGEGANFVIPRKGGARIANMTTGTALSLFREILAGEAGAYWTFLFFDGSDFFVGSTPERHVSVAGGKVRMNPISGTFRKSSEHAADLPAFKRDFLAFLGDAKEINELFMVVDEELKMMAQICCEGGIIVGPLMKEMSRLVHTEYLLSGRSNMDVVDILRDSMFAATVTGSPVGNACNVIYRHEAESRGYYSSALALIGRDEAGGDVLDSPITIRTLEITGGGDVTFRVGGTLVRNSVPADEVRETEAKISAMLRVLRNERPEDEGAGLVLPRLGNDDDICEMLQDRNQYLSKFWFFRQSGGDAAPPFAGRRALLIHNEDDFIFMIRHMLGRLGFAADVVSFADYRSREGYDIVLVGPGPGNPGDSSGKMNILRAAMDELLRSGAPFLAVCLGHQILSHALGLRLVRKESPFQGVQEEIGFFGQRERVGFYNTFAAVHEAGRLPEGVEAAYDAPTGEIHALRGPHYYGVQFHPESILTQNGFFLLERMLRDLLQD